jgi:hypothetical protein
MWRFIRAAILLAVCLTPAPAHAQHAWDDMRRLRDDLVRLCELYNHPEYCVDTVIQVVETHAAFVKAARSRDTQTLAKARQQYTQALTRLYITAPTLWARYMTEILGQNI